MSEAIAVEEQRGPSVQTCRHHWIIETPHGATSLGVCKRCGASKRFPSAADDALRDPDGATMAYRSRYRDVIGPTEISLQDGIEDAF